VDGKSTEASEARQQQGQAKRGSCRGKRSAAVAGASEARQLQGQAKRGSCRGKWKLAQKSGNCPKKRVMF